MASWWIWNHLVPIEKFLIYCWPLWEALFFVKCLTFLTFDALMASVLLSIITNNLTIITKSFIAILLLLLLD